VLIVKAKDGSYLNAPSRVCPTIAWNSLTFKNMEHIDTGVDTDMGICEDPKAISNIVQAGHSDSYL
jgi:hypothetical protein